jgi:hypothetical protein
MCLSEFTFIRSGLFSSRPFPNIHVFRVWHARKDLNPQPAVLETAALPIELRAYVLRVRFANLYAGYASIIIRDGYRGVKQFSGAHTCYIGRIASVPAVDMTRRLRVKSPFPFPTPPCIISQTWTPLPYLTGRMEVAVLPTSISRGRKTQAVQW